MSSDVDAKSGDTEPSGVTTEPADSAEEPMPTLLEQMGGVSGMIYSAVPVIVFVLVNSIFGLIAAIWGALGVAVAIMVMRIVRKQTVQPAVSGFLGVAIAAFIAYRTGSAKDFFLFGIWASLVYGSVLLFSVIIRWPLAGVAWNYLNGAGTEWRKDKRSVRDYDIATMAMVLVFASRFIVQRWLYNEDLTGWLAAAKIGMGFPLWGLALLVVVWAVRRSDKRLEVALEEKAHAEAKAEADLRAKYGDPAERASS